MNKQETRDYLKIQSKEGEVTWEDMFSGALMITNAKQAFMEEVIEKAISKKLEVTDLMISMCPRVNRLPENLHEFTSLQELFLNRTSVNVIPPSIFEISRLRIIKLTHSQFKIIPDEIKNLTNLTKLVINGNPWKVISPEILSLPNLKMLSFDVSEMEELESKDKILPLLKIKVKSLQTAFKKENEKAYLSTAKSRVLISDIWMEENTIYDTTPPTPSELNLKYDDELTVNHLCNTSALSHDEKGILYYLLISDYQESLRLLEEYRTQIDHDPIFIFSVIDALFKTSNSRSIPLLNKIRKNPSSASEFFITEKICILALTIGIRGNPNEFDQVDNKAKRLLKSNKEKEANFALAQIHVCYDLGYYEECYNYILKGKQEFPQFEKHFSKFETSSVRFIKFLHAGRRVSAFQVGSTKEERHNYAVYKMSKNPPFKNTMGWQDSEILGVDMDDFRKIDSMTAPKMYKRGGGDTLVIEDADSEFLAKVFDRVDSKSPPFLELIRCDFRNQGVPLLIANCGKIELNDCLINEDGVIFPGEIKAHIIILNNLKSKNELIFDFKLLPNVTDLQLRHITSPNIVFNNAIFSMIEKLSIWNSDLKNIPAGIFDLQVVTALELVDCNLTEIPDGISSLLSLKKINVGGNPFVTISKKLSALNHLTTFKIREHVISQLEDKEERDIVTSLLDKSKENYKQRDAFYKAIGK